MSPIRLRLRELREAKGWSQVRLADEASTRQATISDLENNRAKRIELDLIERLAAALGVEPGDLIVREPKKGKKG